MKLSDKPILGAAVLLGAFSVLGTGLVAWVHSGTEARIGENQRQTLRNNLRTLLPPEEYDNDILADVIEETDPALGTSKPVPIYRARKQGKPVAVVIAPSAPDGYSGEIKLLVAIRANASLAGVRVVSHKETPGLGDLIDANKSGWILGFSGLSLDNPAERLWKVKRDGGVFDQFTGATITPRAVVKAVRNTLSYFETRRKDLFEQPSEGLPEDLIESM